MKLAVGALVSYRAEWKSSAYESGELLASVAECTQGLIQLRQSLIDLPLAALCVPALQVLGKRSKKVAAGLEYRVDVDRNVGSVDAQQMPQSLGWFLRVHTHSKPVPPAMTADVYRSTHLPSDGAAS